MLAGALVFCLAVPSFAFGWYNSGNGWMYEGTNGNYARKKWLKIGDDWYHFNKDGIMDANCWIEGKYYVGMDGVMLTNTVTPDGYQVGPDGAKIRNEGNNYGAPVTAPSSAISGPGQTSAYVGPTNPNVQPDPLQGVLSAGNYLEYNNLSSTVQKFELEIPVVIEYIWGEFATTAKVTVDRTQDNAKKF